MQALYIVIPVLCIFVIAYRYYSAFIAAKVMVLDDTRVTPAHTKYDGANYHPMSRWVLFGHHFAAIAGPGPLIGPTLDFESELILLALLTATANGLFDYSTALARARFEVHSRRNCKPHQ